MKRSKEYEDELNKRVQQYEARGKAILETKKLLSNNNNRTNINMGVLPYQDLMISSIIAESKSKTQARIANTEAKKAAKEIEKIATKGMTKAEKQALSASKKAAKEAEKATKKAEKAAQKLAKESAKAKSKYPRRTKAQIEADKMIKQQAKLTAKLAKVGASSLDEAKEMARLARNKKARETRMAKKAVFLSDIQNAQALGGVATVPNKNRRMKGYYPSNKPGRPKAYKPSAETLAYYARIEAGDIPTLSIPPQPAVMKRRGRPPKK